MRRWLAALALVPAVAWGDCYSVETREGYLGVAYSVADARERGVSEREAIALVQRHITGDADRAAAYEAIRLIYRPADIGPSSLATAMQNACYQESR